MSQGANFGCDGGDLACMCPSPDFFNGIEDCTRQSCNDGVIVIDDAVAAVSNSAVAMCACASIPPSTLRPE